MRSLSPTEVADCERLVSYITDDGTIAGYLGISRDHVARIRAGRPRYSTLGRPPVHATRQDLDPARGIGADTMLSARFDAVEGSQKLLEAMLAYYAKHHWQEAA